MSKARELLLECKVKLGGCTDYRLAKEMQIDRARISDYMKEARIPDNYACVRMALILKRDPIEIIAIIESENEKNALKREFWAGFLQRVQKAGRLITLALIFTTSLLNVYGVWTDGASRFSRRKKYA